MIPAAHIDKVAARILLLSFFLPARIQIFAAALVCFWFAGRMIQQREWPARSNYLWALVLGSSFIAYILAVPFTPHEYRSALWHICERGEAQLLMPVAFAIMTPSSRATIRGELTYFVYGSFIACTITNADFIYHYLHHDSGTAPLSHVLYRMYFEAICGIHPTYMSMYLCFSVCILLSSTVFDVPGGYIIRNTLLYGILILLLSLLAKSPLIAMVLILIHASWTHRATLYRYKKMLLGGIAAIVVTGLAVPFFRQRMLEIVQVLGIGSRPTSATNSFSDRTMIFNTDLQVLQHYWLTGTGPGRLLPMLQARYFFRALSSGNVTAYFDPHNQYMAIWLSFGIAGLLLFVALLLLQFAKAIRSGNNLYLYLLIILAVTFFTESALYRQQGVVFYAIFTSLFFFINSRDKATRPSQ